MRKIAPMPTLLLLGLLCVGLPGAAHADTEPAWARVSAAQREAAAKAGVPVAFENHIGMRFVLIPGGSFLGGVPTYWEAKFANVVHRPAASQFNVGRAYYLQITELTNHQIRQIDRAHRAPGEAGSGGDGPRMPAVGLTQRAAVAWLAALSAEDPEGRVYRLPTEWEWERACAGGQETFWYWGSKEEEGKRYERLSEKGKQSLSPTTVASLRANPFGLYDMLGNVREWTGNRFGPPPQGQFGELSELPRVPAPLERLFRRRCTRGGHAGTQRHDARRWRREPALPWLQSPVTGFRAVVEVSPPAAAEPRTLSIHVRAVQAEDGTPMELEATYLPREGDEVPLVDGQVDVLTESPGRLSIALRVPSGRRTWDQWDEPKAVHVELDPALDAKHASLTVPLYRTVKLKGVVAIEKGEKRSKLKVWADQVGAIALHGPFSRLPDNARPVGSGGRFSIDKLPWLPGVPVGIKAARVSGRTLSHAGIRYFTMPAAYRRTWKLPQPIELAAEPPPKEGPLISGSGRGGEDLTPIAYEDIPTKDAGKLTLLCKRREGVFGGHGLAFRNLKIDKDGVVRGVGDIVCISDSGLAQFPVVPPGEHVITVLEPGRPHWAATVSIAPGENRIVMVEMPDPARVTLRVTRAGGGPASWARVYVLSRSGLPWHDLGPDGMERIEPRLDHNGEATLHGFSADAYVVYVRWLGLYVVKSVLPKSGERLVVELTLPEERGWAPGTTSK